MELSRYLQYKPCVSSHEIKRKIIHGENHANEVTECASGNGIMRGST